MLKNSRNFFQLFYENCALKIWFFNISELFIRPVHVSVLSVNLESVTSAGRCILFNGGVFGFTAGEANCERDAHLSFYYGWSCVTTAGHDASTLWPPHGLKKIYV